MTSATCVLAHRSQPDRLRHAAPNALICRGCWSDLERTLVGEDVFRHGTRTRVRGLGELWTDLTENLAAGGSGGGARVSGSRDETPLPFNGAVSTHLSDITDILTGWVLQHLDTQDERRPRNATPTGTAPWLGARLDRAVREDWIGDYAAELRQLRGKALALLDPVRRTRFVVSECLNAPCPGWLVADIVMNDALLPATIYCDADPATDGRACMQECPPHRWIELGRKVRERKEAA